MKKNPTSIEAKTFAWILNGVNKCVRSYYHWSKKDFYLNPSQLSRRWGLFQNLVPPPSWVKQPPPPRGDAPPSHRCLALCLPQTETWDVWHENSFARSQHDLRLTASANEPINELSSLLSKSERGALMGFEYISLLSVHNRNKKMNGLNIITLHFIDV